MAKEQSGKKMRFSIRNKILLGSLTVNILILVIMGFTIYAKVKTGLVSAAAQDTLSLVQVSSLQIEGGLLEILNEGDDLKSANMLVQRAMQKVLDHSNVNAIYTVGERNGKLVYLSQPADEGIPIGEPVEQAYYEEMHTALGSNGYVVDQIQEEDDISIITAYAPVTNAEGTTVGILGIDYNAEAIVDALHSIVMMILSIGGLMLIISVGISIVLANGIASGLKKVNNKVSDLVSNNGDLTRKIEVKSNDEVSDIADNINNLLEYIRQVVRNIYAGSTKLTESSEAALNATVRTNDQLDGVAATMEQMSAAMEETSASLQQVQSSTRQIAEDVVVMNDNVQQGTSYAAGMKSRADEMYRNAEEEAHSAETEADRMTESLNDKIEKSKAVEKISQLTETILSIASQTNLLSLNASIEAARAGEHGRGFAVVAGEISNLAANSAETAREIQQISEEVIGNVNELVGESNRMVDFVRTKTIAGYKQLMDTGVQYQKDAEEISEMLHAMEESSVDIEESMGTVSTAMDDVSTAVEESARGVTDVAAAVADMSENMEENKNVAAENAQIAVQLDGEVNKFKF